MATLDVGCGTGYLTRFLRGYTVGADFSGRMLQQAAGRRAAAGSVRADALRLPFEEASFGRVFSSHFYGRLKKEERLRFLSEARRVAPSIVVLDTPYQADRAGEGPQERELLDGSTYTIYKKYFRPDELLEEIGGGEILLFTSWFLAVQREWRTT